MEAPALNLTALLAVPHVEPDLGCDLSPDGTHIAFSWNPTGRWEIYLVPLDGSATPRQITTGAGAKFAPRWSADGGRLLYALDLDGSESFDIYLCDLATGLHSNLTPNTVDAMQPNTCWSPDGQSLALISDRAGRFDTYIMPASGGPARLVLSLPYPDWKVDWSPDGRWLAVVTEGQGQDYWTYIVSVDGSASPFPIAGSPTAGKEPRPVPISAKDARWSPDSKRLAFASNVHGQYDIGIFELETGQITWAIQGDGDKELPAWSSDGRRLACVVSRGPVTEMALLDIEGGTLATYQVEPGVHYQPQFTPGGENLVTIFDNPRHPCDLWLLSLAGGSFRQITDSLAPDLRQAAFTMPTTVRYPSLDGTSVPALLYQPAGSQAPVPAIVYVHGGPNWLFQVTWDPLVQHMVSRGWAILAPNYRGSTGYGREWQLANRFDLGGVDTEDVVAGADFLVTEGIAIPDRIAVTGRSWGGYLTMTCLTQHPDRWAAGSAVVPFLNWFTSHANSREDLQHWDRENFGDPEENDDLWTERSPFFFLDRVAAPVQLICGAHDVRCPASESIQARDRLTELGVECDLALYDDEGHSFLKIENVIDAEKRRVAFLSQNLQNVRRNP